MVSNLEVEVMKEAYGLMYTLENTLRTLIKKRLNLYYGVNWYVDAPKRLKLKQYKRSFNRLNFHELLPFLLYPCFSDVISSEDIESLRRIIPIRNKIAHNNYLSEKEIKMLYIKTINIVNYINSLE